MLYHYSTIQLKSIIACCLKTVQPKTIGPIKTHTHIVENVSVYKQLW